MRTLTAIAVFPLVVAAAGADPPAHRATTLAELASAYDSTTLSSFGRVELLGCVAGSRRGAGTFDWQTAAALAVRGFTRPLSGILVAPKDHPGTITFGSLLRVVAGELVTTDMACTASDGTATTRTDDSAKVQDAIDAAIVLHKTFYVGPNSVIHDVNLDGPFYNGFRGIVDRAMLAPLPHLWPKDDGSAINIQDVTGGGSPSRASTAAACCRTRTATTSTSSTSTVRTTSTLPASMGAKSGADASTSTDVRSVRSRSSPTRPAPTSRPPTSGASTMPPTAMTPCASSAPRA